MSKNKFLALAIIILMLFVGFFQEQVKIGINYILDHAQLVAYYDNISPSERNDAMADLKSGTDLSYDYYHSASIPSFLFHLSTSGLKVFKWVLTLGSVAVHFIAVYFVLFLWFGAMQFRLGMLISYLSVFALAAVVYVLGAFLGFGDKGYAFSRELLGALQSMVPLMFLAPAMWLKLHFDQKKAA